MKQPFTLFQLILLPVLALLSLRPSSAEVILLLDNGSKLFGNIHSWNSDTGIIEFQTSLSDKPLKLPVTEIIEISKREGSLNEDAFVFDTALAMSNGDQIHGHLADYQIEKIQLDSSFGKLILNTDMVSNMRKEDEGSNLYSYREPADAISWKSEHCTLHRNYITLELAGQINANVNLPSSYRLLLQFNRPLEEISADIRLHVNETGEDQWNSPSYGFRLSNQGELMIYGTQNQQSTSSTLVPGNSLARSEGGCQLEILVDRRRGVMAFSADNGIPTIIKNLPAFVPLGEDGNNLAGIINGESIVENFNQNRILMRNNSPKALNIKTFKLDQWAAPENDLHNGARRPALDEANSELHLVNGDTLVGKISKIDENKYYLSISGITIPIERSRVESIHSTKATNQARRKKDDIRIHLYNGDQLTLQVIGFSDNQIEGTSDAFEGTLRIPISICRYIEANLYRGILPALETSAQGANNELWRLQREQGTNPAGQDIIGLPANL